MKPENFANAKPRLVLEDYFLGELRAWGIFEDRFGDLRRQFVVEISGSMEGQELVLDERFQYSDGATDRRVWRIKRIGEHTFEGQASGVIGRAVGRAYGNVLNWKYDFDLQIKKRRVRVHFNDWMFLQPDGVLINRARMTKYGLTLGEVTLFFRRAGALRESSAQIKESGARPHEMSAPALSIVR